MRESASSRIIRMNSTADLDKLKTTGNFRIFCSPEASLGRGRIVKGTAEDVGLD